MDCTRERDKQGQYKGNGKADSTREMDKQGQYKGKGTNRDSIREKEQTGTV